MTAALFLTLASEINMFSRMGELLPTVREHPPPCAHALALRWGAPVAGVSSVTCPVFSLYSLRPATAFAASFHTCFRLAKRIYYLSADLQLLFLFLRFPASPNVFIGLSACGQLSGSAIVPAQHRLSSRWHRISFPLPPYASVSQTSVSPYWQVTHRTPTHTVPLRFGNAVRQGRLS